MDRLLRHIFKKFQRDERGSIITETALIMPFLVFLLFGAVESTRYVMVTMKLERASVTLADLVARSTTLTTPQIDDIFAATSSIVAPFDIRNDGRAIISSVTKTVGNPPTVVWQRAGAGNFIATSRIGTQGGSATLPTGFTLRDGESVVVTEVFYDFDPFFADHLTQTESAILYTRAFFRPRLSEQTLMN